MKKHIFRNILSPWCLISGQQCQICICKKKSPVIISKVAQWHKGIKKF